MLIQDIGKAVRAAGSRAQGFRLSQKVAAADVFNRQGDKPAIEKCGHQFLSAMAGNVVIIVRTEDWRRTGSCAVGRTLRSKFRINFSADGTQLALHSSSIAFS